MKTNVFGMKWRPLSMGHASCMASQDHAAHQDSRVVEAACMRRVPYSPLQAVECDQQTISPSRQKLRVNLYDLGTPDKSFGKGNCEVGVKGTFKVYRRIVYTFDLINLVCIKMHFGNVKLKIT